MYLAAIPGFRIVGDWGDFSSALFSDVLRDQGAKQAYARVLRGREVMFSDASIGSTRIWIRVGASPKSNNNNKNNKILLCKKEKHKRNRQRLSQGHDPTCIK